MAETIFNFLKVAVVVAVAAVFMVAINTLINLISVVVIDSVVGEILTIISDCLPFNAAAVFGVLGTAMSGILAFLVAKKIFDLTSWSVSSV